MKSQCVLQLIPIFQLSSIIFPSFAGAKKSYHAPYITLFTLASLQHTAFQFHSFLYTIPKILPKNFNTTMLYVHADKFIINHIYVFVSSVRIWKSPSSDSVLRSSVWTFCVAATICKQTSYVVISRNIIHSILLYYPLIFIGTFIFLHLQKNEKEIPFSVW